MRITINLPYILLPSSAPFRLYFNLKRSFSIILTRMFSGKTMGPCFYSLTVSCPVSRNGCTSWRSPFLPVIRTVKTAVRESSCPLPARYSAGGWMCGNECSAERALCFCRRAPGVSDLCVWQAVGESAGAWPYRKPENEEKNLVYDNIGPNVCMGDHKPVYLSFRLTTGAGKANANKHKCCNVQ
ncbi:unnamed protein product [Oncorhynchus mykiss]|uniref:Uncharacterized protein n=1 Tax=Oncorhynchus mykiss TaxID=8022 RepID=A0A060WVY1_ONCMY|nr:unnamed protein product [Oncorhynchus mykiss]